jgi:hypothetical protein
MPPAGFEPAIPAGERPQSYALASLNLNSSISDPAQNRTVAFQSNFESYGELKLKKNYFWFSDVRFVYLASEINQHRFRELSAIDPTYPDEVIASPDSNVHTVVAKVISSISSSKFIYRQLKKEQYRQCKYLDK